MLRVLSLLLVIAPAVTPPAHAQRATTAIPEVLQATWTSFSDAWRQSQLTTVQSHLADDFSLTTFRQSYRGTRELATDWPRARRQSGRLGQPTSFYVGVDRIVEMGRTVAAAPLEPAFGNDEARSCDPEVSDALPPIPVTYVREWVRQADGGWRVSSVTVQ
jgi:hypothetical protein